MLDYHTDAQRFEETVEGDALLSSFIQDVVVHDTHFSYTCDGFISCICFYHDGLWFDVGDENSDGSGIEAILQSPQHYRTAETCLELLQGLKETFEAPH